MVCHINTGFVLMSIGLTVICHNRFWGNSIAEIDYWSAHSCATALFVLFFIFFYSPVCSNTWNSVACTFLIRGSSKLTLGIDGSYLGFMMINMARVCNSIVQWWITWDIYLLDFHMSKGQKSWIKSLAYPVKSPMLTFTVLWIQH